VDEEYDYSPEFDEAFTIGGGVRLTCECGILYFDDYNEHTWDWEEGEREALRESAKIPEHKTVAMDGAPSEIEIDGRLYVSGCPCAKLAKYEQFIWNHRRQIADYLKRRSEKEFEQAEMDLAVADATRKNLKIARLFLGDPNDYSDLEAQGIDWRSQIK
jgi:hypothetical protein